MNEHSQKLFNFLNELHEKDIQYVIFRGFEKLPHGPDKDIDMIGSYERYDEVLEIASKHLLINNSLCGHTSYGFGEWCNMRLNPYWTSDTPESWLPDAGYFRIDLQNCLYFKSPYNNFSTYWTVPKKFNDYVVETRQKREHDGVYYYIPSAECDITLLILRDTLDKDRQWKDKHVNRINNLLKTVDNEELLKCIRMVLPEPEKIIKSLRSGQLREINRIIEGI
tara:strand:- start:145 stop:813 length:669 start_codon:yes stop_codon:yes gene_type:complete